MLTRSGSPIYEEALVGFRVGQTLCFIPQYSGIQSYYFYSSFEEGEEQEEEEHEEWVAEEEDVMCDGLEVDEDDW